VAVMSTTTTTNRALHDAFLDLVYADQDLIDAEFDELIAASWTPPPPAPQALPELADRPPTPGSLPTAGPLAQGRSSAPRTRLARQRSPPVHIPKGR
jgi:hypothetical protein